MIKIVFVRHGENVWNLENRFTGWTDVDLSPRGVAESHETAEVLKREGARHSLWMNPANGAVQAVPRHSETPDRLAERICAGLVVPSVKEPPPR
jgi:bisphosphoglycerate-dependent phosphoglycerate mutase